MPCIIGEASAIVAKAVARSEGLNILGSALGAKVGEGRGGGEESGWIFNI